MNPAVQCVRDELKQETVVFLRLPGENVCLGTLDHCDEPMTPDEFQDWTFMRIRLLGITTPPVIVWKYGVGTPSPRSAINFRLSP